MIRYTPLRIPVAGFKRVQVVLFAIRSVRNRGGGGVVSNGHLPWGRIVYISDFRVNVFNQGLLIADPSHILRTEGIGDFASVVLRL